MKNTFKLLFVTSAILLSCKTKFAIGKPSAKDAQLDYTAYYLTMYKADSLFLINDFDGSYKLLDSLFKVYEPLDCDNYGEYGIYLYSAVMSNHTEDIDKKVRFGYKHFGGIQTHHKKSYEMYLEVNKAANISEEEISALKLAYHNSLNHKLRNKMIQMYQDDQNVRLQNKGDEAMEIVDERNRIQLNAIFKEFGFPRKELIGSNNAYDIPNAAFITVGTFFLHQPDSVQNKYLPILLQAAKKGYCEPDLYADLYDRMLLNKNQKQYYGTYTCPDGILCEFSNPSKIDSIRASVGLPHHTFYPWKIKQQTSEENQ
ncbi:MAG: hypothetical protein CFE24_12400 [Flavobacterium sp. BFFFF2]|nr:MAG: hypothetical protein CFE24_12400 [Flavobacterium sp. BFFFF2]